MWPGILGNVGKLNFAVVSEMSFGVFWKFGLHLVVRNRMGVQISRKHIGGLLQYSRPKKKVVDVNIGIEHFTSCETKTEVLRFLQR